MNPSARHHQPPNPYRQGTPLLAAVWDAGYLAGTVTTAHAAGSVYGEAVVDLALTALRQAETAAGIQRRCPKCTEIMEIGEPARPVPTTGMHPSHVYEHITCPEPEITPSAPTVEYPFAPYGTAPAAPVDTPAVRTLSDAIAGRRAAEQGLTRPQVAGFIAGIREITAATPATGHGPEDYPEPEQAPADHYGKPFRPLSAYAADAVDPEPEQAPALPAGPGAHRSGYVDVGGILVHVNRSNPGEDIS